MDRTQGSERERNEESVTPWPHRAGGLHVTPYRVQVSLGAVRNLSAASNPPRRLHNILSPFARIKEKKAKSSLEGRQKRAANMPESMAGSSTTSTNKQASPVLVKSRPRVSHEQTAAELEQRIKELKREFYTIKWDGENDHHKYESTRKEIINNTWEISNALKHARMGNLDFEVLREIGLWDDYIYDGWIVSASQRRWDSAEMAAIIPPLNDLCMQFARHITLLLESVPRKVPETYDSIFEDNKIVSRRLISFIRSPSSPHDDCVYWAAEGLQAVLIWCIWVHVDLWCISNPELDRCFRELYVKLSASDLRVAQRWKRLIFRRMQTTLCADDCSIYVSHFWEAATRFLLACGWDIIKVLQDIPEQKWLLPRLQQIAKYTYKLHTMLGEGLMNDTFIKMSWYEADTVFDPSTMVPSRSSISKAGAIHCTMELGVKMDGDVHDPKDSTTMETHVLLCDEDKFI
ncbi:hypothetical protein AX16_007843 [Volvariella volvacea WC 439]|nr:hypothetical protein AX16_007843 [Volvariella volvacea WC 439]